MIHFDNWPPIWRSIRAAIDKFEADTQVPADQIPIGSQVEQYIEAQLRADGFLSEKANPLYCGGCGRCLDCLRRERLEEREKRKEAGAKAAYGPGENNKNGE